MARIRMITRTVTFTIANVLGVDMENRSLVEKSFPVSGTFTDIKELEKAVKAVWEDATFKVVSVIDKTEHETLYGMTEEKFISLAEVLPPRKVYDTDDSDSE